MNKDIRNIGLILFSIISSFIAYAIIVGQADRSENFDDTAMIVKTLFYIFNICMIFVIGLTYKSEKE